MKELVQVVKYSRSDYDRLQMTRTYHKLAPYKWTNKVYDKFFEETRVPYSLSFKHDKILLQGVVYARIEVVCTNCDSQLEGIVHEKSPDSNTVFHCTYTGNFAKCICGKKQNIQGKKKSSRQNY